jgi:hypothetical protein
VFIPNVTEYNSLLRIMVSSQSQDAETKELKDLITRLFIAYLTTLFELSGIT